MKLTRLLIITLSIALFVSCKKEEDEPDPNITKKVYEYYFEQHFGNFPKGDTWNMASVANIAVDPGNARSVKAYMLQQNEYRLVADITDVKGKTDFDIDVPLYQRDIIVEVGGRYYQVPESGSVSTTTAAPIAPDKPVSQTPYSWMVIVENNVNADGKKIIPDFDFNDAVVEFYIVTTSKGKHLTIAPQAVGDCVPIYLHYNNGSIDELLWPDKLLEATDADLHCWLGVNEPHTRVNTGEMYDDAGNEIVYNSDGSYATIYSITDKMTSATLDVSDTWNMANFGYKRVDYSGTFQDILGFYFTTVSYRSVAEIIKRGLTETTGVYTLPRRDEAPHIIILPNEGFDSKHWRWTKETVSIKDPYYLFTDWIVNQSDPNNYQWPLVYPSNIDMVFVD